LKETLRKDIRELILRAEEGGKEFTKNESEWVVIVAGEEYWLNRP